MSSAPAPTWLTATEIARLGLPGLPADRRRIIEQAAAEGWTERTGHDGLPLARQRCARGGGIEYHASLLPREAQECLLALTGPAPIAANDTGKANAEAWTWYSRQSASIKAKAERRLAILKEIEGRADTVSKTSAINTAAKRHGIGLSTIAEWFVLVADLPPVDWLPRLAPKFKGGGKEADIAAEAWQILKSDYLRPEEPSFATCYHRLVEDYATPRGITVPHMATLKRRMDREISKPLKKSKRKGREALRRSVAPQRRSVADLHALEAVNADGHTCDVRVEWEDGKIDRPVIVGIQDIAFRKILAYEIDRSESTVLARQAFYKLFRDWGVPRFVLMDNGRAFASKALTGGMKTRFRFKIKNSDPTGVLTALGVIVHWALPYRGQSKPIERAWKDFCEDIAMHPAMAGAYTGNKPTAKPENYGTRAIPIAEFRAHVERQIAKHNARTGRRTEMAKGGSLDDAFAASYAVAPVGRANIDQLALAMMEAEDRRCHRDNGSITLAGNVYWSPEIVELAGEIVSVRCDADNLHSDIHVYRKDGRYFGAVPVLHKTGFFDKAGAARQGKLEKDLRRKTKAQEEAADLLTAARVAELLFGPLDPAPQPVSGVTRIVRHGGQTVAALKQSQQAKFEPAAPDFIDGFAAGVTRLRSVE